MSMYIVHLNLLFLAGSAWQLRLIPKHWPSWSMEIKQRGDIWCWLSNEKEVSMFQFENEPQCSSAACHSTVQLNCSSTLITDPPCCHTEANSSNYTCKSPGEGFLSTEMTLIDAAKWHKSVPTTHTCQERRETTPHTVTALWPLRSPWTQHVPPWLGMSLWLALMIECFPRQNMYYTRDASPWSEVRSLTCLPPAYTPVYHGRAGEAATWDCWDPSAIIPSQKATSTRR